MCVTIPVRNEAKNIEMTLDSFAVQVDLQNNPLDKKLFEIVLLANNCSDASAEIARNWSKRNLSVNLHVAEKKFPKKNANVGFVRRLIMNEAFARLKSNKYGGVIMTTDGDTRVAPDWIAQNLAEIERGADAVGGRILIENDELAKMDERARYFHLHDEEYRLLVAEFECLLDNHSHDASPRHHQHFNASFAVKTEAFEQAGGIPGVECLEDVAFYRALLRIDAKFRHSPLVKVFTSARNVGRATFGLSRQINEWTKMGRNGDDYLVESAAAIEKKTLARKALRHFHSKARTDEFPTSEEISRLAEILRIPAKTLFNELKRPQTFGNLMERISCLQNKNRKWRRQNPPIPIEDALSDLIEKAAKLRNNLVLSVSGSIL